MIEYLVPPTILGVVSIWSFCMGRRSTRPEKKTIDDGLIEFNGGVQSSRPIDCPTAEAAVGYGYTCPKCDVVSRPSIFTPKYCECAEHADGHFHFVCAVCGFKAIMRTKS